MLFDTSGRRKHVVRVVYAILALLMGASLFLVIGPFSLADLVGTSGTSSATKVFDEQTERIERRLVKSPDDEQLLLALTRAQISAGNAQIEVVSETEVPEITVGAREDFERARATWNRYLKQADEPSATAAQLVAGTFFRLAEASTTLSEVDSNVSDAAAAQRIAAEQRPNVGSLSTLAIYEYFSGNFAAADKAGKKAAARAPNKAEAKNIEKQLAEYRKRAQQFAKQKKEITKAQRETGKESLQNPFGGLGGATGGSLGE